MAQFVKKENLTISIGEYEKEGQTKKQWRTIGEIVSMIGDDGQPYQFFKLWGAGGVVEGKVFEQQDNNQQSNNQGQQQNNGGFQHQQAPASQQQGFQQQGQNFKPYNNNQ